MVLGEQVGVLVFQILQELGRALDIGEQERNRPGWQGHFPR